MPAAAPRVTIAIPTYRGAATLPAAIESVLGQTLGEFELLVVDDASPDDTAVLVGRYADPRLAYHRNPVNLGPEGNWNRCLELARGRYFKLLPHDDVLRPDCLARQAAVLEVDVADELALTFSARSVLAPDGRALMRRGWPGGRTGRLAAHEVARRCVRGGTNLLGEPGAVLFRRSLARRVGDFDGTNPYVIDLDYWLRLLVHGDAWYDSEPLAGFRVSRGSWSVAIGRRQSADFRGMLRRLSGIGVLKPNATDRAFGTITPTLNTLARLVFYRLFLQ
jgi:glycosyltransferase involved in cell wall biosynthesis